MKLARLLDALDAQTLARDRWELILSLDGADATPAIAARLGEAGAIIVSGAERRGPGAARNAGVRIASGDFLAFTEDDCVPAPDWLAEAAARLDRDPPLDVLEGATLLPNGLPARRRHGDSPTWLPTNLFVRRDLFVRLGGFCEAFFDPRGLIYFREDSDFGFALTEAGARISVEMTPRVIHPREHPSWLDPIRWARRYEMDPLLRARHPKAFREEIEVRHLGPLRIRRPFVRACVGYVVALTTAGIAATLGETGVAAWFLGVAAILFVAIWAKWRLDPRKLPAVLFVPPVLLASLAKGRVRISGLAAEELTNADREESIGESPERLDTRSGKRHREFGPPPT